jgi:phosphatidylserine/phosphatidylglycerophosphate/cardiolipin synthase-like enzyme
VRASDTKGSLTARAIAGAHVVLFGMSVEPAATDGLLGFAIEREEPGSGERFYLANFKLFKDNDLGATPDHSSEKNPFQGFVWGDYAAEPGTEYTYRVSSRYGDPTDPEARDTVELALRTEAVVGETHAIFFNRGAAASQGYAQRFPGGGAPGPAALEWLSRGLVEAIIDFIGQADGAGWGLRAAIYEFQYVPVLRAFGEAAATGADVKVVFDDIDNSEPATPKHKAKEAEPSTENRKRIEEAGIGDLVVPRRNSTYISHNKFIVLLKDGEAQQVWTGSTNLTDGGIFGHSNVGHLVRDPEVAAHYLDYWKELSEDPDGDPLKDWTTADSGETAAERPEGRLEADEPRPPDNSLGTVFSPRHGVKTLQWYAKLMDGARSSVFLTAAFGVGQELAEVFGEDKPYLRYLLLDNRNGRIDTVARGIESDPDNRVAAGAYIGEEGTAWRQWVVEKLTGLNHYVQFIHTKYMLIDPLGEDPIVITGSANFSDASTSANDENMLVIRGNTRVADVYLGEFMRLFTHFRFRARVGAKPDELLPTAGAGDAKTAQKSYLDPTQNWLKAAYVPDSPEEKERLLFSGAGARAV